MLLRHQDGLTLVELLSTLAIVVIIATLSLPSWQSAIEHYRAQSLQSNLRTLFHQARMAAVHERSIVTLCPLSASNQCTNQWNTGITVFLDPNNDRALNPSEQVVHVLHAEHSGTLRASKTSSGNQRRYFQYRADGSVRGTIGHLIWCPESNNPARAFQLRLNFGGRIRWAQDNNQDGIVEKSDGSAVGCPLSV
ncbi:MAG: GspH/FimT family pseudopilin [Saccharospirillum sp.]